MAADKGLRKLAAILAADVAGYSRLMADDEHATVATLTDYHDIFTTHVEAHQGRIVDTAGDSVLATFDSVVEAVEAAVAVQRELAARNEALAVHREMHFRIGVNLGDIIVRQDGTVYGDGVNIAARLEGLAAPGGVMISEDAYRQVEGKLEVVMADAGEHEVKNIVRPVRAYRVALDDAEVDTLNETQLSAISLRRPKVIASLVAAVAVLVGLAVWGLTIRVEAPQMVTASGMPTDDPVLVVPEKPSIAVLPFTNLSGDAGQDYFSDGVTEDIISALSRFRELFVIARNSTFVYKGRAVDLQQVGRELGVAYVLEGSVRRSGERVRVAAQLIDAKTGGNLWSETYERDIIDILEVQAEIGRHIAGALVPRIERDAFERTRHTSTKDLTAYENVLRAMGHFYNPTVAGHAAARDLLEEAARRDPDYARAHAELAFVYLEEHSESFNPLPESLDRAGRAARRAVELDPIGWRSHWALAEYYFYTHQIDLFEAAAKKTLELNPNAADALSLLAFRQGQIFGLDRLDEIEEMIRRAMRLNPNHASQARMQLARALFFKGSYEEALAELNKAGFSDDFPWKHYWAALIQARLGNLEASNTAAGIYLELRPGSTMASLIEEFKASSIGRRNTLA